jgi:hypothetical protein
MTTALCAKGQGKLKSRKQARQSGHFNYGPEKLQFSQGNKKIKIIVLSD